MCEAPGKVHHGSVCVGVLGRPRVSVLVGHYDNGGVEHLVAGGHAGFHGLGVDEGLYGRAHLTLALTHVVVFEVAVVRAAHIRFHVACSGLNGHEGGAEEGLVVADGVVRGHGGVAVTGLVPGEHPHFHGLLEGCLNLCVRCAGSLHHAGAVAPFAGLFHGGFNHGFFCVRVEGRVPAVFEFTEESLLEVFAKVFGHGFLCVLLHLVVDGGINPEAVAVKVIWSAVALEVLVQPSVKGVVGPKEGIGPVVLYHIVGGTLGLLGAEGAPEHVPEVRAHAGGAVSFAGVKLDGEGLQGVAFGLCEVFHLPHAVQHKVAAPQGVVRVDGWIVAGGLVHHSNQHGAFLGKEFRGLFAEELVCGRRDAVGI